MRALINAFIVHITLNILVFLKGWYAFDEKKGARIILIVVFGTELLVYSFGLLFYRILPDPVNQSIRVMGTSWMLFLLYTSGMWLLIDLTYLILGRYSENRGVSKIGRGNTKPSIFWRLS